ncbi:hypothetical protein RGR602_PC01514 (plasmid) [Rhizobium gallicum bv. gallicum R602sp]|uniref:Uncharacterized protein n=1 Tax=Rhizobium gallicum bv. gallicum R602sp TaxID=1041138 RepID=A0A0B4XFM6_9HYPH|nr:hypothetical protein RGR602_PC01514 [Rhizobium gallicum bv. gallicum R602sp]
MDFYRSPTYRARQCSKRHRLTSLSGIWTLTPAIARTWDAPRPFSLRLAKQLQPIAVLLFEKDVRASTGPLQRRVSI